MRDREHHRELARQLKRKARQRRERREKAASKGEERGEVDKEEEGWGGGRRGSAFKLGAGDGDGDGGRGGHRRATQTDTHRGECAGSGHGSCRSRCRVAFPCALYSWRCLAHCLQGPHPPCLPRRASGTRGPWGLSLLPVTFSLPEASTVSYSGGDSCIRKTTSSTVFLKSIP